MFGFGMGNQTVKEQRKNKGLTISELADYLKLESSEISRVDNLKLKDVGEPLYSKLVPVFRGDVFDKIPW